MRSNSRSGATTETIPQFALTPAQLCAIKKGTCPHKFKNPSLTYFEPDMAERIEQLKSDGVEFVEEMPNAEDKIDNAIAEAPDGQYFFLFFYDGEM